MFIFDFNMKNNFTITLSCFIVLIGSSCNLTKKTTVSETETQVVCNDQITYSNTVKAIFDARCTGCHSGQKPAYGIDLTSYESASKVAAHRLNCVITWDDNCNKMPPSGGQLSSEEIQQINCWAENGFKN